MSTIKVESLPTLPGPGPLATQAHTAELRVAEGTFAPAHGLSIDQERAFGEHSRFGLGRRVHLAVAPEIQTVSDAQGAHRQVPY